MGGGSDAVSISRFHRFAQDKKLPRKFLFEDREKIVALALRDEALVARRAREARRCWRVMRARGNSGQ